MRYNSKIVTHSVIVWLSKELYMKHINNLHTFYNQSFPFLLVNALNPIHRPFGLL